MADNFLHTILDFLFPKTSDEAVLESLTSSSLLERSLKNQHIEPGIIVFLPYKDEKVKAAIHSLKYKHSKRAAELLSDVIMSGLSEDLSEVMQLHGGRKNILIPIPMSSERQGERGANQCELLAETIMERGGGEFFEYAPNVLTRVKETPPQTSIKNRSERLTNMSGVFEVTDSQKIKGRTVMLLDDVTTTGATMGEARKVLIQSGARDVLCIAAAH